jgi:hypothetical protein
VIVFEKPETDLLSLFPGEMKHNYEIRNTRLDRTYQFIFSAIPNNQSLKGLLKYIPLENNHC